MFPPFLVVTRTHFVITRVPARDNLICQERPASSGKTSGSERSLSWRTEFPDQARGPGPTVDTSLTASEVVH